MNNKISFYRLEQAIMISYKNLTEIPDEISFNRGTEFNNKLVKDLYFGINKNPDCQKSFHSTLTEYFGCIKY